VRSPFDSSASCLLVGYSQGNKDAITAEEIFQPLRLNETNQTPGVFVSLEHLISNDSREEIALRWFCL